MVFSGMSLGSCMWTSCSSATIQGKSLMTWTFSMLRVAASLVCTSTVNEHPVTNSRSQTSLWSVSIPTWIWFMCHNLVIKTLMYFQTLIPTTAITLIICNLKHLINRACWGTIRMTRPKLRAVVSNPVPFVQKIRLNLSLISYSHNVRALFPFLFSSIEADSRRCKDRESVAAGNHGGLMHATPRGQMW